MDGQLTVPCPALDRRGSGRTTDERVRASRSTSAPAARRSGCVSLTGRDRSGTTHCSVETRWLPGGGAMQDADEWWELICATRAAPASRAGAVRAERGRGGQLHRAVGEHRAGRRGRRARSATACSGWTAAAAPSASASSAGTVGGYAPVPLADLGPAHRGRALDRPAPTRSATCSTSCATSPSVAAARTLVPRAGRLPVDALHRHRDRVARVDDRRVAHRQPPPRPRSSYDEELVALGPASTRRSSPPLRADRLRRRDRAPDVAAELGLPDGVQVSSRALPTCTRRAVGAGTVARLRDAPGDQHDVVDRLPGAVQEDRRAAARSRRVPGPDARPLPDREQPRDRRARACSGCATQVIAPDDGLDDGRRPRSARSPTSPASVRRAPAASSSRRGSTGERSPVDDRNARGGFHNLSLATGPGRPRARGARGRRLQQPLAARGGREVRRPPPRPDPDHRRRRAVGPVVPDPRRRARPRRSSGSPTRSTPTCAAPRCSPASRSGRSRRTEVREPGRRSTRTFRARPGARGDVRPALREFPKLYKAQRGMFRRVNA